MQSTLDTDTQCRNVPVLGMSLDRLDRLDRSTANMLGLSPGLRARG